MTPDANDLCVFAVKRGDITKRFDVGYCNIESQLLISTKFKIIKFGTIIQDIYRYPTFYGINYISSGTGIIKGENISRDGSWINLDKLDYIDYETNKKYGRTVLKENDLVVTVRGEVGKVGIASKRLAGCNINANVIKISLLSNIGDLDVNPQYIWAYLNSQIGKKQIKKQVAGGVQETITVDGLFDIDIILPPHEIQNLLYSNIFLAELKRTQSIQNADELLAGMSDCILSALRIAPIKFDSQLCCKVKMSDVISDKTLSAGYYHPERMAAISSMKKSYASCVKKIIEIVDFHRDIVSCSESSEEYLGLAGVESQTGELSGVVEEAAGQAFKYEAGDILYGRLRPYLNKVLLAESSGICSTEFHVMRIKEGVNVLPGYLAAILRSDLILSQTKHMMTGNTHPRISNDDVKNLYIPVPELSVQRQIEEELSHRRFEARKLKQQAEADWAEAKAQFEKELLEE